MALRPGLDPALLAAPWSWPPRLGPGGGGPALWLGPRGCGGAAKQVVWCLAHRGCSLND